jgi:hypothetical protein
MVHIIGVYKDYKNITYYMAYNFDDLYNMYIYSKHLTLYQLYRELAYIFRIRPYLHYPSKAEILVLWEKLTEEQKSKFFDNEGNPILVLDSVC